MNYISRTIAIAGALAIVVVTARFAASTPEAASVLYKENVSFTQSITPSQDRNIAPDFSWLDRKGNKVSMSDLKGKVVFINFWATWCRPCRTELPDVVSLVRQYEGDVVFIGVAMERPGGDVVQNLLSFAKEQRMNYQLVVGSDELATAFGGLAGVPTTFVVDKQGKIAASIVGMRNYKGFEEELKKVL